MSRPYVVWGMNLGYSRQIVATTTKKAAREAFDKMSAHSFDLYASDTSNEQDIAVAMSEPGTVFRQPNNAPYSERGKWWKGQEHRPWDRRPPDYEDDTR